MDEPRSYRQHRFTPPPGATDIVLVRHGESAPTVDGVAVPTVDGHSDPPLAPEGREQARRVCERLATAGIERIYVTTLRRTHETAALLASTLGIVPEIEPDLREVHLGEWEGDFRKLMAQGHPIGVRMLEEQRWDVIPGAEPAEVFAARVKAGIDRIASVNPDRKVAVFAHGGTIGEVLAQATGASPFAFVGADNASISRIVVTPTAWILRGYNDVTHLDT